MHMNGREPITITLLVFLTSLLVAIAYDNLRRGEIANEHWAHTQHLSEVVHSRLQGLLERSTKPVNSLALWLATNPGATSEQFDAYAGSVMDDDPLLRHIAWLPDNLIRYIYPREGDEAAIGLDVAAHPLQHQAALEARERRERVTTPPLELVQGGTGVILRAPVFTPDEGVAGGRFLGLVSAVMDLERIIDLSGLRSPQWRETAALRYMPEGDGEQVVVLGHAALFDENAILHEFHLSGATWQLAVRPDAVPASGESLLVGRLLSVVLVMLVTGLSAIIMHNYRNGVVRQGQQRREKEFIDSVLDTVGNVICVMNRHGHIVRFNKEAERVSGYRAGEVLGGYVWDFVIPQEQVEGVKGVFSRLVAGNFPNKYVNHWRHRDGGRRLISWSNTALIDSRGEVEFVVATGIDITEREQREREKEQLQRQLIQVQKMEALGQLTGGVAHDFNNIIAAILGNAELATLRYAREGDGRLTHYLGEITRSAQRARKLVVQMLAFSRGDTLATRSVDVRQVIEQLLVMLNSILPATIEIETDIVGDIPSVKADENQLDQVLLNLAINGRDALNGKGRLAIDVERMSFAGLCHSCHEDFSGDFVRLSVTDSAGTLPEELLDKIFDPFFTTKEVGKGTGMGLSMVHGIVHGWDGHLVVVVEPGISTSFHLYIPVGG